MVAKRKTTTKKDLEEKIAELEEKLSKLSTQLEKPVPKPAETKPAKTKPAETKPAKTKPAETKPAKTKPAETKPAKRPVATTKPKGTLPKGFGTAETSQENAPKPAETKPAKRPAATTKPKGTLPKGFGTAETSQENAPKPAETNTQPPATVQAALEDAYYNALQTDFHQYRAKVTGYSPAPNRYFVRRTAPVGKVPTTNWNEQKAKVTGYTQPSNQYFATRARLAYHPSDKMFGSFSGQNMTVDGVVTQVQQQQTKPRKLTGTLPKGMEQPQTQQPPPSQQQTIYSSSEGKSRKDQLEEYEKDYLERIEQQRIKEETEINRLREEESKKKDSSTRGSLPKGFEPQPEPEAPKPSRGTLPKGF